MRKRIPALLWFAAALGVGAVVATAGVIVVVRSDLSGGAESAISAVLLGLPVSIAAAWIYEWWLTPLVIGRPIRKVLNFNPRHSIVFVFPTRRPKQPRLLDDVAWEDVRAISYVERALALTDWDPDSLAYRGLDPARPHFDARDRQENVVLICSPTSNSVARDALARLRAERGVDWEFSRRYLSRLTRRFGLIPGKRVISDAREIRFNGVSYHTHALPVYDRHGQFTDFALLAKFSLQSWNPQAKILMIAGIRAVGTWGCGKFIYDDLQDAKVLWKEAKGKDFGVVLEIVYEDWRIASVRLVSRVVTI